MGYLGLACAVALAGVFAVSVRGKAGVVRFRTFVATAGPLELLPRRWRGRIAAAVTVTESAVVTALAVGVTFVLSGLGHVVVLAGFIGVATLLLIFTVAIGLMLRRGDRKPCHCFGTQDVPLGPAHVVRNLVLLALAVVGPFARSGDHALPGVVLAFCAGALVAALLVRFDDLVALFSSPAPVGHVR